MARYIRTVAPELLIKANAKAIADRQKYGSADVTVSILTALGKDHTAEDLMAVSYRMMALAKVLQNGDGEHWTLNVGGREYKLVNEVLFRAAAIAPLQQPKFVGEVSFNPAELLEIALQQANSEGSA